MAGGTLTCNGRKFSRLGFGCWQLAGDYDIDGKPNGYGFADQHESIRAVHMALDNGINFFDTSVAYGYGKSEELLGKALKSYPGKSSNSPVICTKFGFNIRTNVDCDFSEQNLLQSVDDALNRLQADQLDILLMHNPPDDFNFAEYDTHRYEELIKQGKIGAYGVSARTQKGVANVLKHGFGSALEAVYNVLDRRYRVHFSDPAMDKYLFICRVPLASGFISKRTLKENREFPNNDIRRLFNAEQVEWVTNSVRKLAFLDELEGGITVSALRFQLSNPYNTVAIPGQKDTKQVADTLLALQLGPLPDDVLARIEAAVPEVFYKWRG